MQHRLVWSVSRTEDQQSWAPSASDDEVGFALETSWNPSTLIQNDAVQTLKLNLWTLVPLISTLDWETHGCMDSWCSQRPTWSFLVTREIMKPQMLACFSGLSFCLRQWRHKTWTDFLQPSTVSSRERVKPMAWSTKDHCHNHTCLPDLWKPGSSYRWSLHCGGYTQLSSYFFLQFLL